MRFFLLFSLATASLFAMYQGSPTLPEMPEDNLFLSKDSAFSLKATYQADVVLGRNISISSLSESNIHAFLNGAEIAFGISDRFEIYSLLGAFHETITGSKDSDYCKLKIGQSFGGEIGARVIALFWGETKIGFDAKYFYGYPHLKKVQVGNTTATASAKSWQREWQLGVAISQKIAYFTPYVGANFSRFAADFTDVSSAIFSQNTYIQNTSPWGFVVGLGVSGIQGPFLDVEARFFDEYAFSGAVGIRF